VQEALRGYVVLSKPGIVAGNCLTAVGGYLFAADGEGDWRTFLSMLAGVLLVVASAGVVNNVIDRDIDAAMARTMTRPVVTGVISARHALLFALVLFAASMAFFAVGTHALTLLLGVTGFVVYAVVYTYAKRKTVHGTLIGGISGAIPPLIGYSAYDGSLSLAAGLLFVILAAWQVPHFFAIAIFRYDDYKRAHIPVLPVVRGLESARRHMVGYTVLYVLANAAFVVWGQVGLLSSLLLLVSGLGWLWLCLRPVRDDIRRWARRQFFYSLGLLFVLTLALSLDHLWR
jgi:protoheme IX farnesyltransferase